MPFLRNVWVATLTSNTEDAGTDSEAVFIMNKLDLDYGTHMAHRALVESDVESRRPNGCQTVA